MENKPSTLLYPNLRYTMSTHGITIASLAEKIGVHSNTVRRKMSGVASWTLEEINAISDYLNKDISYLFKKAD
jgi:transcriptional regulator with XRE-family HTH domain